jgi:hypothetical protein
LGLVPNHAAEWLPFTPLFTVRAIEEQATSTTATKLGFDERFSMLVQAETAWRDDKRVQRLLKAAKLKVSTACVEDINWRSSRGPGQVGGHGSGWW